MSQSANQRSKARDTNIAVGDTVLVKHDFKENKMSTVYDPKPRTVTGKKGPMITVTGGTTRNASRFKMVQFKPTQNEDLDEIDTSYPELESSTRNSLEGQIDNNGNEIRTSHKRQNDSIASRRSIRERRQPIRMKDYLCYK